MTHEYTILVGATVIVGGDEPDCAAVAWADDTILALGSEAEVRGISRGDSHVVAVRGAFVRGAGPRATLEVGGPADLELFEADPRAATGSVATVVIRGGRVVAGELHPHH